MPQPCGNAGPASRAGRMREMTINPAEWDRRGNAARLCGVPDSTVYDHVRRGTVRSVQCGAGTELVSLEDVRQLANTERKVGRPAAE